MTNVFENSQKLDVEEPKEKSFKSASITEDLTGVKGIGPSTALKLNRANINTFKQLADVTPNELSVISGVNISTAQKFISEAKNHLPEYSFETFDVAEIFIEEKLLQEESDGGLEIIKNSQEQLYDIFNSSRLNASYPPISENSSNEPKVKIEEIQEHPQEQMENTFNEESFMVEKPPFSEEDSREDIPIIPEVDDFIEVEDIPEISKHRVALDEMESKVEESLKMSGYYIIPSSISTLNYFMENIDFLGCKLVRVSKRLNQIILVPIKIWNLEGTVLVNESQLNSTKNESSIRLRQDHKNLLHTRNSIFDDIVNGVQFREFFQKYLKVNLAVEKSVENKKLYFVSGQTQFKMLIEPILVCKTPPRCMEKSISFPYQRNTNLHVIHQPDLSQLLDFIEQKYGFIESRVKNSSTVENYQKMDQKFRTNIRIISVPIVGYAIALAIIYFAELFFLLRLFNSVGFAIIGIYILMLTYLYFKFFRAKKELALEFETPYYMQNLEFNEVDLLEFKDLFSTELLAQFGYECFGKEKKFKVLEKNEQENYMNDIYKREKEIEPQVISESKKETEEYKMDENPTYNNKYLSFLEE